jgi:2-dehydro-3-deoxygluconokinase
MGTKILCVGEALIRLIPVMGQEWIKNASIKAFVGGAELNVANALTRWDRNVKFYTALPDHAMTQEILQHLNDSGIDTSAVLLKSGRLGTYYIPQGADMKSAGVIYDRAFSSFSELGEEDLDLEEIFTNVEWLHISAINPALNQKMANTTLYLVKKASERNIKISIDLNYRAKLWQYGVNPSDVMTEIVNYCDVVMGNVWAAKNLLDIPLDDASIEKEEYTTASNFCFEQLESKFPKICCMAFTFRFDAPEGGVNYSAVLKNKGITTWSQRYHTKQIVDRVGSGDCFMAGLIDGLLIENSTDEMIINFCCKAALMKLGENGDHTRKTKTEILRTEFTEK